MNQRSDDNPTVNDELRFDETAGGDGGTTCTACHSAIGASYHTVNGSVVCDECRAQIVNSLTVTGSGSGRFLRALGFGMIAAAVGAGIYYAILALTGYEIGLVAIVVGFLVGRAVHTGSRGRGGWGYQSLAVALTYAAIVTTYIPFIIQGFMESEEAIALEDESATLIAVGDPDRSIETGASETTDEIPLEVGGDGTDVDPAAASVESLGVAGILVGFGLLFVIAALSPFLAGLQNIIGLLIIGFALYEAWSLNRRVRLDIKGPFNVRTQTGAEVNA